jgi:hypothetical protein
MLNKSAQLLVILFFTYFFMSCTNSTRSSPSQKAKINTPNYINRVFSLAELDNILSVGMSSDKVIKKFGVPYRKFDFILIYKINPSRMSVKKNVFIINGFSVSLSDNKVIYWGITSTITRTVIFDNDTGIPIEVRQNNK